MKLIEYLKPELIKLNLNFSSKKKALEAIGCLVTEYLEQQEGNEITFSSEECFSCLFKREKLGATSINYGIAMPHTKLPNWKGDKPIAVFLQLGNPIDYETLENKDVDLIFAVIFPDEENEEYKSDLQNIAKMLNNKQLSRSLKTAQSLEEVLSIFDDSDESISLEDQVFKQEEME